MVLVNIGKRLAHLLLIIWLTLSLIFLALVFMRGNPISLYTDPRLDAEHRAALERNYGYDQNPATQYFVYLRNMFTGELGDSFLFKRPVAEVVPARLISSVGLGLCAYACAAVFAVLLLLGLDRQRNKLLRRICEGIHMLTLSVPSFVVATLLMALLGVRLRWLPISGSHSLFASDLGFFGNLADLAYHSVLPVLSLALPFTGQLTAYLQEQLQALERAPFVISARGRGISERRIFWNHKMRVLLPAVVQLGGIYLPTVAMGTLIVESIFGWAGMGQLLFDAVVSRDYPLLLGGSLGTIVFVVTGYELADYLRASLAGQEQTF